MRTKSSNMQKGLLIGILTVIFVTMVFMAHAVAGELAVSLTPPKASVLPGESTQLEIFYNVIEGEKQTTGLGLRVYFNSLSIADLSLKNIYWEDMVGVDTTPQDDVDDSDKDPLTDKYIGIAWMSINKNWPSVSKLPLKLGDIFVKMISAPTSDITRLNIRATSCPVGYKFQGNGAEITVP